MIKATPKGDLLEIEVSPGSTTYIGVVFPCGSDNIPFAQIPESSVRSKFTVTDRLDIAADEYLIHEENQGFCAIATWLEGAVRKYAGIVFSKAPQGSENRFVVTEELPHEACVLWRQNKVGVTVDNWRFSDLANVNKSEEIRRARMIAVQKNTVYI